MRCIHRLTRAVRGCPRPWQEVGWVVLLAGLLWAAMAWGQGYTFEPLECFVPTGVADGQIRGSTPYNGQACGSPLNFAARILDGQFELLNHPLAAGCGFAINSQLETPPFVMPKARSPALACEMRKRYWAFEPAAPLLLITSRAPLVLDGATQVPRVMAPVMFSSDGVPTST
jgi:hypothetical protein